MEQVSFIVLCNDRIAIPALRLLDFHRQLKAVVVPARNREFAEELKEVLDPGLITQIKKSNWKQEVEKLFLERKPVAGLLMTFPWRLEKELLAIPGRGFMNFHYGLLPAYRGSDPLFFQLRNEEPFAGLCIHKVGEEMDRGEIVMEEKIQLKEGTTYGWLKSRLSILGASMAGKLSEIMSFSERLPGRKQNEAEAHWYAKPLVNDVLIKWQELKAQSIIALINACNPWNKGAGTMINGLGIRILEAEVSENAVPENMAAGKIVLLNSGTVEVATLDGKLIRLKIIYTPEGFMSASRLGEYGIKQGDQFS